MESVATVRIIVLACCLLFVNVAFGQTLASIGGDVRDSSGATVSGAMVTAVNVGTNAARTAVTNEAGAYSFPSLPPGMYVVKIEKSGFKTAVRNEIELQV